MKSEEIDARREERHGKETELAALRSQADHGATFTETTAVVAHEYRLATRERRALVAHCNAGDTITLPPQSWAAPPPSQLLSDTELSLSPTETNWGESTAVYEWTISTGELRRADGTWGSAGVLVVTINGRDYYDTENSSWWDSSWPYRMKLTIDNSASAENLIDFPLLVKLTPARFDYSFAQVDGDDIRFVDADGTALDYEVDTWTLDGESFFWARVPQIDALSTTDYIWMYWGTPTVANGENAEGVWNDNYVAVYHMNDDGAGTGILDSTSNSNDGTKGAGAAAPTEVAGTVGRAQQFVAANQQLITLPDSAALLGATQGTWTAVVRKDAYVAQQCICSYSFGADDRKGWIFGYESTLNAWRGNVGDGNNQIGITLAGAFTVGEHFAWMRFVGNDAAGYTAGCDAGSAVPVSTATVAQLLNTAANDLTIGKYQTVYSSMTLDELRLSSVARSGEWIEAEYLSMWDAMLTYGDTEGVPDAPAAAAPVVPLTTALLTVGLGIAAVKQRHIILYTAAFIMFLFVGLAAADDSLITGIPVVIYAGYMLYALMLALGGRR